MRRRTLLTGIALTLVGTAWFAGALLDRSSRAATPVETPNVANRTLSTAPRALGETTVTPTVRTADSDPTEQGARSALETAPMEPVARKRGPRPKRVVSEQYESTSISGRVSTPSGLALEAIMVSAAPDSRRKATKVWTRTDADGRFEFEVPRRFDLVYRVQVGGTTEDRSLRRLIQDLKGKGELRVEDVTPGRDDLHFIIPAPGSLALIAVDSATGMSLPGLAIEARLEGEDEFRPHGRGVHRLSPDERGRFIIALPAGPIALRIFEPRYVPIEKSFVVPPTPDPLPEVLEFTPCARVELDVQLSPGTAPGDFNDQLGLFVPRDALGRPVYKAAVMLLDEEEHERYIEADAGSVDDVWLKDLSGRLKREGRLFEEEDGTRVAWPPPGNFRLAAYPRSTRFDPPTLTVGSNDQAVTVTALR